ncbi:hypothetical protein ACWCW7_13135 [Nocardia tengchongensis]
MSELGPIARGFIEAAFKSMRNENAIPTSGTRRRLKAGVDFSILDVQKLPEYGSLATAIVSKAPQGLPPEGDIIAPAYVVGRVIEAFLEHCVAECSWVDSYDAQGSQVDEAIDQLEDTVSGQPFDIVVARHVSHLVTESGAEVEIDGVTVVPESLEDPKTRIRREIPDSHHSWDRKATLAYRPPHGLLIAREQVFGVDYHGGYSSRQLLDRFLLAVCLLKGSTADGNFEIVGASKRVTGSPALIDHLISDRDVPLSRRTVRLDGNEGPALAALTQLVEDSRPKGEGLVFSSFGSALKKFSELDHTTDLFEQLVSLATALEGGLIGSNEGEGLTLRLCTRATAILAHDDEPAEVLFEELKRLYNLRSKAVHGGELELKALRKELRGLPSVPRDVDDDDWLFQLTCAVDRLRDIVRRALLARMCLASGAEPIWPFRDGNKLKVDAVLSNDAQRAAWRSHWRDMLESMGAGEAARRLTAPVYSLGPEDR